MSHLRPVLCTLLSSVNFPVVAVNSVASSADGPAENELISLVDAYTRQVTDNKNDTVEKVWSAISEISSKSPAGPALDEILAKALPAVASEKPEQTSGAIFPWRVYDLEKTHGDEENRGLCAIVLGGVGGTPENPDFSREYKVGTIIVDTTPGEDGMTYLFSATVPQ